MWNYLGLDFDLDGAFHPILLRSPAPFLYWLKPSIGTALQTLDWVFPQERLSTKRLSLCTSLSKNRGCNQIDLKTFSISSKSWSAYVNLLLFPPAAVSPAPVISNNGKPFPGEITTNETNCLFGYRFLDWDNYFGPYYRQNFVFVNNLGISQDDIKNIEKTLLLRSIKNMLVREPGPILPHPNYFILSIGRAQSSGGLLVPSVLRVVDHIYGNEMIQRSQPQQVTGYPVPLLKAISVCPETKIMDWKNQGRNLDFYVESIHSEYKEVYWYIVSEDNTFFKSFTRSPFMECENLLSNTNLRNPYIKLASYYKGTNEIVGRAMAHVAVVQHLLKNYSYTVPFPGERLKLCLNGKLEDMPKVNKSLVGIQGIPALWFTDIQPESGKATKLSIPIPNDAIKLIGRQQN